MNLKKITSLVLALTTGAALTAQTYVVLVNPEGSKEWGYIKTDGQYLIEPQFRKAAPFASNGLAVAQNPKSKEYQFINTNGEWLQTEVTDFKLKSTFGFGLKGFSEGLAPIGKDKKWGYLGEDGKVKIALKYDDVSPFEDGHAVVRQGETYMVIDTEGNEVTPPSPVFKMKDIESGMIPFYTTEKMEGFVNTKGEIAIAAQYSRVGYFNGDLAWARNSDEKIGYINKAGEWVIQPQFDAVKDFPEGEALARVKLNDSWTYVNRSGEIVNLNVEDKNDFAEGLAYGKKGDLVGFYDASGTWVIEPQFEAVRDFKNGYAAAKKGELWGLIDKTGAWVLKPQFDGIKDVEKVN